MRFFCRTLLTLLAWVFSFSLAQAAPTHGLAVYGDLKYPEDFTHFDYVNPDAPKGGHVRLGTVGDGFDSLNPFLVKGVAAEGLDWLYDSLTKHSGDEPFSEYGLIAQKIEVAEDRTSVTFHLNPQARFQDGHPITAEDVAFTFEMLTTHERANPFYRAYYRDVKDVKIIDERTIRFEFQDGKNRELPLILGQMKVLPKHYFEKHDFGKADLTIPVGSGPYRIEKLSPGQDITYTRVKDYWAKDLPVNRGFYNFDRITIKYFKDSTVALEALKSGDYDFRQENVSKFWATAYIGPAVERGDIIKEEVRHGMSVGMQGFLFNTRRPMFDDPHVREALAYAFDFEWTNQNLFYNQYSRTRSYFQNSELAATGTPGEAERALLEPFRGQLDPRVWTTEYNPPSNPTPGNIRQNLKKAVVLLKKAGWGMKNGVLTRKKDGTPLQFEILLVSKDFERIVQPFIQNLSKIGVKATIRLVDSTQYINRIRSYDFDMFVGTIPQSLSPGNEQMEYWHSTRADQPGSRNYTGVRSPVIDALVERVAQAPDRQSLVNTVRALDRVLQWQFLVIPQWHIPYLRLAYWKQLAHPDKAPLSGLDFDTWWMKP
ncbi:MAG: ABC transporter substrate-binding protein [Gammaproteobacteria bacterium]|nr:MAG: ABC transporter substrate-binding protein [Gammaproteobacteria bacterium]